MMPDKPMNTAELFVAAADFIAHADMVEARQALKQVLDVNQLAVESEAVSRQRLQDFIGSNKKSAAQHLVLAAYMLEYAVNALGPRYMNGPIDSVSLYREANAFVQADKNKAEETLKTLLNLNFPLGSTGEEAGGAKDYLLRLSISDGKKNPETSVALAASALEYVVGSRAPGRWR